MQINLPITHKTFDASNVTDLFLNRFLIPEWLDGYNHDTTSPVILSHIFMSPDGSKPFSINTEYNGGVLNYFITLDPIGDANRPPVPIMLDAVHSIRIRNIDTSIPLYLSVNKPYGSFGDIASGLPLSNYWGSRKNDDGSTQYYARCVHGLNLLADYADLGSSDQTFNIPLYIDVIKNPVSLRVIPFFFQDGGESQDPYLINALNEQSFGFTVIGNGARPPYCQYFGNYLLTLYTLANDDSPSFVAAVPSIHLSNGASANLSSMSNIIEAFFGISTGEIIDRSKQPSSSVSTLDIPGTYHVIKLFDRNFTEITEAEDLPNFFGFKVTYTINSLSLFSAFANNKSLYLRCYDPTIGYEPVPTPPASTQSMTKLYEDRVVFNQVTTGTNIGDLIEIYDHNARINFEAMSGLISTQTTNTLANITEPQNDNFSLDFLFDYTPSSTTPKFNKLSFGLMTTLEDGDISSNTVSSVFNAYIYLRNNKSFKVSASPLNDSTILPSYTAPEDYSVSASGNTLRIGIRIKLRGYWNGETKIKLFVKDNEQNKYVASLIERPIIINSYPSAIEEL